MMQQILCGNRNSYFYYCFLGFYGVGSFFAAEKFPERKALSIEISRCLQQQAPAFSGMTGMPSVCGESP